MSKETQTRLTLECNDGHRYIWESPYFDDGLDSIIEAFHGLLIAAGWQPKSIIDGLRVYVEERTATQIQPFDPEILCKIANASDTDEE
jgi:hypothetical protein